MMTTQDVVSRIRAEFLEMPGMRLTIQQVERLFGIERILSQSVLDSLVDERFLCVTPDGLYGRLTEENVSRPRHVKAFLRHATRIVAAS
jgi:hypothetical protein